MTTAAAAAAAATTTTRGSSGRRAHEPVIDTAEGRASVAPIFRAALVRAAVLKAAS